MVQLGVLLVSKLPNLLPQVWIGLPDQYHNNSALSGGVLGQLAEQPLVLRGRLKVVLHLHDDPLADEHVRFGSAHGILWRDRNVCQFSTQVRHE